MKFTIITCSSSFSSIWKYTKEPNIDIKWAFNGSNSKILSFIRMMWFKYNLPMKKIWIHSDMSNLNGINIIFDSGTNEFLLHWIKEHNPRQRCILYYWNTINNVTALKNKKIQKMGYEIWSFDFNDAKKYGYRFNPQFFCPSWYSDLKSIDTPLYDISFVGRDKHKRMLTAEQIVENLSNANTIPLTSNLYFTAPKWYFATKSNKYKKILKFKEMLNQEMQGRILLDITDDNQAGFTLRVFDALCNGRKLITNNINIINESYYDKNNIFIYGFDPLKDFRTFLNTPFSYAKIKEIYNRDITHWLNNFI